MEGNAGPAWSFENLTPFTSLGVPREHSLPRHHEPSHANHRESSSQPNYYTASGQRARTPDAAMRARYSASRESTVQPTDRPTSADPAHPSVGGRHLPLPESPTEDMASVQALRFEGDGFDMRRPVGWQSRAEGQGRAEDQHLVEVSDGDDDEPIVVDEDGEEITASNERLQLDQRENEEVVDLTEDDTPMYWQPGNDQAAQNGHRILSQPRGASRPLNHDALRLPRGMAGIINLDNGEEAWTVDDEPVVLEPSSPDIQFVSARRLEPANRTPLMPQRNDSDGDDVQFVREQPLSEQERRARQTAARHAELDRVIAVLGDHRHDRYRFTHLRDEIDRANAHIQRASENMRHGGPVPPPRIRRGNHIRMGIAGGGGIFVAPNLNFGLVGFDLGYANQPEPPPPTYEALPPAPEGFTRCPEEDDILVCPNCDSELCKGDDDVKKQVWIAKQCGHVSLPCVGYTDVYVANIASRSIVVNVQRIDQSNVVQRAKRSNLCRRPGRSKNALLKDAARRSRVRRRCSRSTYRRFWDYRLFVHVHHYTDKTATFISPPEITTFPERLSFH